MRKVSGAEEQQEPQEFQKPSYVTVRVRHRTIFYLVAIVIVLCLIAGAARFFHWHNWGLSAQEIQAREVASLVQQVSGLMLLPQGETPVVATVTDAASLQGSQAFYKNAENGDALLVYSQAQEAILYRPSIKKIINVGPVYLNTNGASQTPPTTHATTTPDK